MKGLVIIGNSGAARECYWLLQDVFSSSEFMRNNYKFDAFVAWNNYQGELKELTPLQDNTPNAHIVSHEKEYIIGIGDVSLRKAVFEEYKAKGATFINLIHPSVYVCPSAAMGEGNILQRDSAIYCNAVMGNANYLNGACNLAHDAVIGDYNFLGPYSMVLGNAKLGSANNVAPRCMLLDNARCGNNNHFAPASIVYKGCKDKVRMAGNPALRIGEIA